CRRSGKPYRSPTPPIPLDASDSVVPVVDRGYSRRDLYLAKSDPSSRIGFRRSFAVVLDDRGFSTAPYNRPTSGLLFHEYVERVRNFCRDRVGKIIATMASSRR